MKQAKQRVIVLDYLRGVCILIILISHSYAFSWPYTYLSGMGRLWTSAAEMFFLLSGITLGVVRGGKALSHFSEILKKSWKRSRDLYLIHVLCVAASLGLSFFLASKGLADILYSDPQTNGLPLLAKILTYRFSATLANFLIYYAVFMLFAPFLLYAIYKWRRAWAPILLVSIGIFLTSTSYPVNFSHTTLYTMFATWQLYFVIGIILARFKHNITGWIYQFNDKQFKRLYSSVMITSTISLGLAVVLGFNLYPIVNSLTNDGYLPIKLRGAYYHLLEHKSLFDSLFMNSRTGILRPLMSLLIMAAAYLLFQRYKSALLKHSGKIITTLGSDTLSVYIAQAILIPVLAAIPLGYGGFVIDTLATAVFFYVMWCVAARKQLAVSLRLYMAGLRHAYYESRNSVIYSRQGNLD